WGNSSTTQPSTSCRPMAGWCAFSIWMIRAWHCPPPRLWPRRAGEASHEHVRPFGIFALVGVGGGRTGVPGPGTGAARLADGADEPAHAGPDSPAGAGGTVRRAGLARRPEPGSRRPAAPGLVL